MLIIHGDNTIVSRDFFLTQKKSFPNILELSGEDLTFARLTQALATPNLFGELPTLFIENFFSRRPSNEKKKIIEFLKNQNIIFYDSKFNGTVRSKGLRDHENPTKTVSNHGFRTIFERHERYTFEVDSNFVRIFERSRKSHSR